MDLIVKKEGYVRVLNVACMLINGNNFSIYKTDKDTHIFIKNTHLIDIDLYEVNQEELPLKLIKGNKIATCQRVFSSENKGEELDKNIWNNCNDIVAYEPYITFQKIN